MAKKKATELEFLKWFYLNADFGPADSNVRYMMKQRFMKEKKASLPQGYQITEDK